LRLLVDIQAPPARVLGLIADLGERRRFLPDAWRFIGTSEDPDGRIQIEFEAAIGPLPLHYVIRTLLVGENQVVEGAPGGYNYVTTWTVTPYENGSVLQMEMQFEYGGFLGEFLVKRRLRKAYREKLLKLKRLAEESIT
jgi:carbon monoxide dehydrogenase subunit G